MNNIHLPRQLSSKKNLTAKQETQVWPLGWEYPLQKQMATHSSVLIWEIPWTEEPDRLWSMGSQRVRLDLATKWQQQWYSVLHTHTHTHTHTGFVCFCLFVSGRRASFNICFKIVPFLMNVLQKTQTSFLANPIWGEKSVCNEIIRWS